MAHIRLRGPIGAKNGCTYEHEGELFSVISRSPQFTESVERSMERLTDEIRTWTATTSFGWGEQR